MYSRNKKIISISSESSTLKILLKDFRMEPIEKILLNNFISKFKK